MFALVPLKQAALLCLRPYWISDGSAYKFCFCWVNIRPMIGWEISEQVCQVERLESNLDRDVQACLDWEHLLPWPLIFILTSPKMGIHNGVRQREDREQWS